MKVWILDWKEVGDDDDDDDVDDNDGSGQMWVGWEF